MFRELPTENQTNGNEMTNNPHLRATMAYAALQLAPPLIRQTLLDDAAFRSEFGFKTDAVLDFGDSGVSIQRSTVFDAARKVLAESPGVEVTDEAGKKWQLINKIQKQALPVFAIIHGDQSLDLPDLNVLSQDKTTRLRWLEKSSSDVNLPARERRHWHHILSARPLEDEEVGEFYDDIRDTPVHMSRAIRREFTDGKSGISTLVPPSLRYFERLIGAHDGSDSVQDYATTTARQHFEHLSEWRPYDGFLLSLFLCSHSSLTAEINTERLLEEELIRAFGFLEEHGDRISQVGAVEVGLRILTERPAIEAALIRLIEQIRDDDVEDASSGFKLLSALFGLVDGELSRTRLLSALPPFYRRLASLAQAALIHRQYVNAGISADAFCEWAFETRGGAYLLQTFADLRLEPRWTPNLASASQIQAEFLGRIMVAARNHEDSIKGSKVHALALGEGPGGLRSHFEFFRVCFPGPLEGGGSSPNPLPTDYAEAISTQLSAEEAEVSSFVALVNAAQVFRVEPQQAESAARLLKSSSYQISGLQDRSQLLYVLDGLATVAAVTRSRTLAEELRILVRRYGRDAQYNLSVEDAMRVCLVAAASRADLDDWREFVGAWLTELAFGKLDKKEAAVFHWCVQYLCHAVPELWVSCGRAEAALEAFSNA